MRKNIPAFIPNESRIWDEFVAQNGGEFYHLSGWTRVMRAAGYRSGYVVFGGKDITVVLPLVRRGRLSVKFSSLPLVDLAGPVPANADSLRQALDYCRRQGCGWEIYSSANWQTGLVKPVRVYVNYVLDLGGSYREIFTGSYHHKTRNMVRKGEKSGLTVGIAGPDRQLADRFYRLYLATMRRIGALAENRKTFRTVADTFKKEGKVITVSLSGRDVCLLWFFKYQRKLYIWANASEAKDLGSGANYLAYDRAIRYALEQGCTQVVLGASQEGSPQGFFKSRWGARPVPVFLYSDSPAAAASRWTVLKMARPLIRTLPIPLYRAVSNLLLQLF